MTPHKCPVCVGGGTVPGGFYDPSFAFASSAMPREKCRTCNQTGLVWQNDSTPTINPVDLDNLEEPWEHG